MSGKINKGSSEALTWSGAVPDHQLLKRIAAGSYGEVWLGRCALGQYRAVKIVHRSKFLDSRPYEREFSGIQRFEPISREHVGLIDILQVGRNDDAGFFYYIMELADPEHPVNGGARMDQSKHGEPAIESYAPRTLARVINSAKKLPATKVLEMSIRLTEALAYLHSCKLLHRDIKPSNILFAGGFPKLADAGLVADLGEPQSFVGTAGFIPPEGPGTIQADIYSLGKVIYEAATGKDRQEFPDLPTDIADSSEADLLAELNEVILRACAINPSHRYGSAREMLEDLNRIRSGQSLRRRRIRGRNLRQAAVLLAFLALAATALIWFRLAGPKERVLFEGQFDASTLSNRWKPATKEWPGFGGTGQREVKVAVENAALIIETKALHENGWSTHSAAWVDSELDFRTLSHCVVELTLRGDLQWGDAGLAVSDHRQVQLPEDVSGLQLLSFAIRGEQAAWDTPLSMKTRQIRLEFLEAQKAVLVYPDLQIPSFYTIVSLEQLTNWHLRLYTLV